MVTMHPRERNCQGCSGIGAGVNLLFTGRDGNVHALEVQT